MRFFLWFFAVVGMLTVLFFGIVITGMTFGLRQQRHDTAVAATSILRLDLNQPFAETEADPVRSFASGPTPNFKQLVDAIHQATVDPRIRGLTADAGDTTLGMAQVQELRDALAGFRATGKFAIGYAEGIGDLGGGTLNYYLMTSFDHIWVQPLGNLGLTGLAFEMPFMKGTLDKIGIRADFDRRGEYKSAMTQLTETKLLPTDRAALDGMVHSLFDQLVNGIAASRKLTPDAVRDLIDNGPFLTQEAFDKKLIDQIGYHDEMEADALKRAGEDAKFISLEHYVAATELHPAPPPAPRIALIRAVGTIASRSSPEDGLDGGDNAQSGDLVAAFKAATDDPNVRAIVLRIDSPGGSDVASETIWRATQLARARGKPVIASMGDTAASGGYYIASGADSIVAEPATITGSIGVFGGKIVFGGLWSKIGLTWDEITYGRNADIGSSNTPFSPAQRRYAEAMLDQSYKTFVARVAAGRHMTPAAVDAIGRGHVWTGVQASQNGLVDKLGGMDDAIKLALAAGHIPNGTDYALIPYPRPKSLLQSIRETLSHTNMQALEGFSSMQMLDSTHVARILGSALSNNGQAIMPAYVLKN